MNDLSPDGKGIGKGSLKGTGLNCCQPADGQESRCCGPKSWGKCKALIAVLIILAAIAVGAHSFMRGNAAQSGAAAPASSGSPSCGASCTNPSATSPQAEAANPGSGPAQSPCCPGKAVQ